MKAVGLGSALRRLSRPVQQDAALQQMAALGTCQTRLLVGDAEGLAGSALVFGARPSESSREGRGVEGFIVPQTAGQGGEHKGG